MQLPDSFITTIQNTFKEDGEKFLAVLPFLIEEASQRWGLTNIQPVSNLSYNFVAYAKRPSTAPPLRGTRGSALDEVVLKIGVPSRELLSEIAALRLFNGEGAVRLLEADESRYMFLLERVRPGKMLTTLEDDDQRTHIAADVMSKLWRKAPESLPFIKLTEWFDELKKLRTAFAGEMGPFPEKLVARVEETLPRLYAESSPPCLIHGDFHHFNVLSSERGWIAIDPKGVIGHAEYEVGPLLINPLGSFLNGTNPKVQTERRLSILSERLGFPRQRLLDWALCHAILSAWWDMQPDGTGGEYSLRCAELFASL
ncbi:MAG: aminoglycoside phosphotransferase family protein [Anaerolineales bacterium]|nr:aminoglycoside phosphotransferase family protein [Anaerolineales bacterium]